MKNTGKKNGKKYVQLNARNILHLSHICIAGNATSRERAPFIVNSPRNSACFKIASWRIPRFDDFRSMLVEGRRSDARGERFLARFPRDNKREGWEDGGAVLFRNKKNPATVIIAARIPSYLYMRDVTSRIVIHPRRCNGIRNACVCELEMPMHARTKEEDTNFLATACKCNNNNKKTLSRWFDRLRCGNNCFIRYKSPRYKSNSVFSQIIIIRY